MAVLESVREALDAAKAVGWRRELAETLAQAMDESPNASTAKELQLLMAALTGSGVQQKADVSDDLAAKRAARRAAG